MDQYENIHSSKRKDAYVTKETLNEIVGDFTEPPNPVAWDKYKKVEIDFNEKYDRVEDLYVQIENLEREQKKLKKDDVVGQADIDSRRGELYSKLDHANEELDLADAAYVEALQNYEGTNGAKIREYSDKVQ
jgi:hypothetical protein